MFRTALDGKLIDKQLNGLPVFFFMRLQSSASPDHGEDGQHHSHPRIRQGGQRPTAGTARPMRGGHFCPCGGRPKFGWQAHTVRGAIAGALKKKLGLDVISEKIERRGRVYRIAE
jgi:hypothetical protein